MAEMKSYNSIQLTADFRHSSVRQTDELVPRIADERRERRQHGTIRHVPGGDRRPHSCLPRLAEQRRRRRARIAHLVAIDKEPAFVSKTCVDLSQRLCVRSASVTNDDKPSRTSAASTFSR